MMNVLLTHPFSWTENGYENMNNFTRLIRERTDELVNDMNSETTVSERVNVLKHKVVVFGTKQSSISLMKSFIDEIDLIVTVSTKSKSKNHIAGEGDVKPLLRIII